MVKGTEIDRFIKAAEKHGLHSNRILVEAIGTRTKNQVAHFKHRYIKDHEQWWPTRHLKAPSLESQMDQATQSSPSISPSSRRSVSSQPQPPSMLESPDPRATAEEVDCPLSLDIFIPLATEGQRNSRLDKVDQILARLRAKDQPIPEHGAEGNNHPTPPSKNYP